MPAPLCSFLFRWASEAFSHEDMSKCFRFFPFVTSLCVSHSKSNFLGTTWSDSSEFCMNTMTGLRSIKLQFFGRWEFFRWVSFFMKVSFFEFFIVQMLYFLRPVFTVSFQMLVFLLIDEKSFSWAACCDIFATNIFTLSFSGRSWIFDFFSKHSRHSPLPSAFPNFDDLFCKRIWKIPLLIA